jgi:hypothetical protein
VPGTRFQVAVPDGWHARVELAGIAEERVCALTVAFGVRGPGVEDQPPGGDLLPVLLPQLGAGGIEGSGTVGQLPGTVQVPFPVGLVGGHGCLVGLGASAVCRARR